MKMKRHYFISSDLDDLELMEEQLESAGIPTPQIHVLSLDDTETENHHHLHDVQSLMKRDLIHSGLYGALIGACLASAVLIAAYLLEWYTSPAGWIPFIFLAVICLGFSTWEGGLWGIQNMNVHFKQFQGALEAGRHIFFVDLEPDQEPVLGRVIKSHPTAEDAGSGAASPHWVVMWQGKMKRFFVETMP